MQKQVAEVEGQHALTIEAKNQASDGEVAEAIFFCWLIMRWNCMKDFTH